LNTKRWILYNVSTSKKCTSNQNQVIVDPNEEAPIWTDERKAWMIPRRTWECTSKIVLNTMVTEPSGTPSSSISPAVPPAWQTIDSDVDVEGSAKLQHECEAANLLKDGFRYKYNVDTDIDEHKELKCSCIRQYKRPTNGTCHLEQVIDRANVNFFLGALNIPRNPLGASCSQCPSGRGGLWCSMCPLGFSSANQTHSAMTLKENNRITFLETRTCLQCSRGRFSHDPSVTCKLCAEGRYSDIRGISECKQCDRGFYYTPGEFFCIFFLNHRVNTFIEYTIIL